MSRDEVEGDSPQLASLLVDCDKDKSYMAENMNILKIVQSTVPQMPGIAEDEESSGRQATTTTD